MKTVHITGKKTTKQTTHALLHVKSSNMHIRDVKPELVLGSTNPRNFSLQKFCPHCGFPFMFGALTWHISGERCIWTLLQVSFSFSRKHSYSANVLFSQDLLILSNRCNVLRQALPQQTDP